MYDNKTRSSEVVHLAATFGLNMFFFFFFLDARKKAVSDLKEKQTPAAGMGETLLLAAPCSPGPCCHVGSLPGEAGEAIRVLDSLA